MEGCDDKVENSHDDGDCAYREPNWQIKFGDIVDKGWGVKSSPEQKSDSSMKTNEEGLFENKGWMSLTSCSCFTILTTNPIVLDVKIVSWKLWIKLSPTMW